MRKNLSVAQVVSTCAITGWDNLWYLYKRECMMYIFVI